MPVETPEQYELKVLSFYLAEIERDVDRPTFKKYIAIAYLLIAILSLALVILLYKWALVGVAWLCVISSIGGMSVISAGVHGHSRSHMKIIRGYIDAERIRERIRDLTT